MQVSSWEGIHDDQQENPFAAAAVNPPVAEEEYLVAFEESHLFGELVGISYVVVKEVSGAEKNLFVCVEHPFQCQHHLSFEKQEQFL